MPYRTFIADEFLTDALVNEYLMGQSVIECTSGTRPTTGLHAGMVIAETDTHRLLIHNGADWVDLAAWSQTGAKTWTPTITQSGTVGATVTEARFVRNGAVIRCWADLAVSGSGTSGNAIQVTLPAASSSPSGALIVGAGTIYDTSGAVNYSCAVQLASASAVLFKNDASQNGGVGALPAFGLAPGDVIRFTADYLTA